MMIATLALAACGDDTAVREPQGTSAGGGNSSGPPEGCAPADMSGPVVTSFDDYPPVCLVEGKGYRAIIETNHGTLHIDLEAGAAPITVNSFVNLARSHYYDDTTCHRAIQNFVVQCGDPTGTGSGGPGYTFEDETDAMEPYTIGSVAMANAGPDTNGSQFFITTSTPGHLTGKHTIFGEVISGYPVVEAISAVKTMMGNRPADPVTLVSVTVSDKPPRS